ncbi:hypothetical protein CCB80_11035 [Armatimonadetes bacterium Uphvl-Ar1]|nr:hypothetical protein CCB80_11035 [Armatimonadetes bacterium Uphvl-Ar1]
MIGLVATLLLSQNSLQTDFRVTPYLLAPHNQSITITWFSHSNQPGTLTVANQKFTTRPTKTSILDYHSIEEAERSKFPDMATGTPYKHQVIVKNLTPNTTQRYTVTQGKSTYSASFRTAPKADSATPIRIVAIADCETEPDGRNIYREWSTGTQHPDSTGRPADQKNYLVTETQGFIENLKFIRQSKPNLIMLAGDIVQGGGYQRAWDEFFFHTAGKFDDILGSTPLIPAIGNWENFGARVGGYEPWAVKLARDKYASYFDAPANNVREYKNFYHRQDYGPVTIITLDSSNGLPDNTDNDTNKNINESTYPGNNLTDLNPGSAQWNWCMDQLKEARSKGQIILVQFHHIPYSSGGHSLPTSLPDSSGQSGLAMRAYTPYFQKYGVSAIICGHNESFERSQLGDIQIYDVGVAGDGLGSSISDRDPRRLNPWRKWVAHVDSTELWRGSQLIDGGKHYGHLEIDIIPSPTEATLTFTPVYSFPVTNEQGKVTKFERRVYNDQVTVNHPRPKKPLEIKTPGT